MLQITFVFSLLFSFLAMGMARPLNLLFVMDEGMSDHAETIQSTAKLFFKRLEKNGINLSECRWSAVMSSLAWNNAKPEAYKCDNFEPLQSFGQKETAIGFWEQGMESSFEALLDPLMIPIHSGAPLAVVYISNQDDYSCAQNCYGEAPEKNKKWVAHPVSRYSKLFKFLKDASGTSSAIYPIVGNPDSHCDVVQGTRYLELLKQVGEGKAFDVCEDRFALSWLELPNLIGDFAQKALAQGKNADVEKPEKPHLKLSFKADPNRLAATEGVEVQQSLLDFLVGGKEGITFSKSSGPTWLTVTREGLLSGTPGHADIGESSAILNAFSNEGETAQTTIIIDVRPME